MKVFVKTEDIEQIMQLENVPLKEGLSYFFALFFKHNPSRKFLLQQGLSILYIQNGVIHGGNFEGVDKSWRELTYPEFLETISA